MSLMRYRGSIGRTVTPKANGNWQQKNPSGRDGQNERVKGVEPDRKLQNSIEKQRNSGAGGVKAALPLCPPITADVDLQAVIESWPKLSKAVRAALVAMVRASSEKAGE